MIRVGSRVIMSEENKDGWVSSFATRVIDTRAVGSVIAIRGDIYYANVRIHWPEYGKVWIPEKYLIETCLMQGE